jgi:hypothetical protein
LHAVPGRPTTLPPDPRFHRPHIHLKLFAPLDDGLRPAPQREVTPPRAGDEPHTAEPDETDPT